LLLKLGHKLNRNWSPLDAGPLLAHQAIDHIQDLIGKAHLP